MAQNGSGGAAPVAGHVGRIPNFGKTHVNPMGSAEPPACIQNAMMTKDKKPFTYTPGGLDLSQIRTPSMARRLARQRSQEEHEQAYQQAQGYGAGGCPPQGGPAPPPPPPPSAPAPPPPPPIVIEVPKSKSPKPVAPGERPEIVIPENPIGMLRKTNSPYHWEAEKAELERLGNAPKFQEKKPSPLTVSMPPASFSQQPPPHCTPPGQHFQRPNYQYGNQPESPLHRPEAQYPNQKPAPPQSNGSPYMREVLQRQDSQFNKSPQPFASSPTSNGSPYSPTPNNNWKQPERRDARANNVGSPQSPHINRHEFPQQSPRHEFPQQSPRYQNQTPAENSIPPYNHVPKPEFTPNSNAIYNNTREAVPPVDDPTPWRSNANRQPREPDNRPNIYHNSPSTNQQPVYTPPWKTNDTRNNQADNSYVPPWKQDNHNNGTQQQQYNPPWATQDANDSWRGQQANGRPAPAPPVRQEEPPRYQSTMSIPITPRKQNPQSEYNNNTSTPQREIVYVNQEPVYYCPESPKAMPAWVKSQKEKTKTPPPAWCQRPLEGRKSLPRDLVTPPRETNQEPEWVKKSMELQRGAREVVSPPKYQQPVQPTWSTRPSDNRKSVPRDSAPTNAGPRVVPIQIEASRTENRDYGNQQPPLRIVIDMQSNPQGAQAQRAPHMQTQGSYSQPTQRIMRVLSPQLVRMDEGPPQHDLPTLSRNYETAQDSQPKTRIIPIQIEGGGGSGANHSFGGRY